MVVHGYYKFGRKQVAYRNGYCHHCARCTRQWQYRYFLVIHLFWIPVLPLGFWREWICGECERNPVPNMRRGFGWALGALLLLGTYAGWMLPIDADEPVVSWVMRAGFPLGLSALLWHLFRPRKPVMACVPAHEKICPRCQAPMVQTSPPQCPMCGLQER